ncbi:hypothetical protein ACLIBH_01730 [Virgibacillus sp. W0430]|uniref:hypothetical protein n=1 Tax=Virgibacillus sp. W0430 TaxID=3391580 RepID=UPI003F4869EE
MQETTIYFVFTNTGTYLSRLINLYTRQPLNHVSIAFDDQLNEMYSFGRKNPNNPFSGGFVREDTKSSFLQNASCAIYSYSLTQAEFDNIVLKTKEIEAKKDIYKYNFLGLIGFVLQIEFDRKHALFCSQFVATVLSNANSFRFPKPECFVTPTDIRNHIGMQLIYHGRLGDYTTDRKSANNVFIYKPIQRRQSFFILLTKKVKRFVIR